MCHCCDEKWNPVSDGMFIALHKLVAAEDDRPLSQILRYDSGYSLCVATRAHNVLKSEGVDTVGKLCSKSENDLRALRHIGETAIRYIIAMLNENKLSLRPDAPERLHYFVGSVAS